MPTPEPPAQAPDRSYGSADPSGAIPAVSLADNLVYNLAHVLPYYLQGIFTRNRLWTGLVARFHPDPLMVRFVGGLIRRYRSRYLYVSMLGTRSLLVLELEGIERVLDNSPLTYADAKIKRRGMSHFQPNAVTISRGEEWRDRRRFNEGVLDFDRDLHRDADHFRAIVAREVAATPAGGWPDFELLFERITLQVIFGQRARDDRPLIEGLKAMLRESNRVFLLGKSRHFDDFYARVRAYLRAPEEHSLVARCGQVPASEMTRVENQIPHWMFAMSETLAVNAVRTLGLIASHPEAEGHVAAELGRADLASTAGIDGLAYLEGCFQEGMRLWPTTPLLVREMVGDDMLGGALVPSGTQVLILNGFNHRDRATCDFADAFRPEVWLDGRVDYRFNHLSNGTQVCAGKPLVLFLAKAALALLLRDHRYVLRRPMLDPHRPLPYAFDHFAVRFSRRRREPAGVAAPPPT
jgi:cytochrome P450